MKHDISKKTDSINITITNVGNDKDFILGNLNACKEGNCSCPTNEYEKLENIEISVNELNDNITVNLEPKKDKKIVVSEIKKCLDHIESKLEE